MIACMDVSYRADGSAVAACLLFQRWIDRCGIKQFVERIRDINPYEPGRFYKRELPCLLCVLSKVTDPLDTILIDGYVWFAENKSPGLGAYLYRALDESVPVIGVAKSIFKGADSAQKVLRGGSKRPLYITAAGIDPEVAAGYIKKMHGAYRIPTLLKEVDRLCRL